MNIAARLDRALRLAGFPIEGVSIGVETDPSTWRVHYQPIATAQQRIDGDIFAFAFDPTSTAAVDAEYDAQALQIDDNLLIQAVAQLDFEERQKLQVKAGQTLRTSAECRQRVRQIYRTLLAR